MKNEHKIPITVVVPVKNEEANLEHCLKRLNRFNEVVVIDSGSSDRTRQIAEQFGAVLIDFVWNGKFPKKRNWYLLNATPKESWILFLDADEFVNEAFCDAVAKAVQVEEVDGYWLTYSNYFLGHRLKYGVVQRKLALIRAGKALYEEIPEEAWSSLDMEIHEHPIVDGCVAEIPMPIDHRDYKGIGHFVKKHIDYAEWEARRYLKLSENRNNWSHLSRRQRFKYSNICKFWYAGFYFLFTYFFKLGFLDSGAGFHYAAYKYWYFQTIRLIIREHSINNPSSALDV